MKAVIHLYDYDPDDEDIVNRTHVVHNPGEAADSRAVIDGVDVEWYPGGGNIHVTDDRVEEVAELIGGSVLIDGDDISHKVENAGLVTVYAQK